MSEDRQVQLEETIKAHKHGEVASAFAELIALRREMYRDKLEKAENEQIRGKSLECKDLLQLFS